MVGRGLRLILIDESASHGVRNGRLFFWEEKQGEMISAVISEHRCTFCHQAACHATLFLRVHSGTRTDSDMDAQTRLWYQNYEQEMCIKQRVKEARSKNRRRNNDEVKTIQVDIVINCTPSPKKVMVSEYLCSLD